MKIDLGVIIIMVVALIVVLSSGLMAGLGVLLYGLLIALAFGLCIIPFVGPILYFLAVRFAIEPFVAQWITLSPWTSLLFWIFLIFGISICIITTLILLAFLFGD